MSRAEALPSSKKTGGDAAAPIESMTFEAAMAELERIVALLEKGDVPLERSIQLYERGDAMKRRCETLLQDAEARISKISLGKGGEPTGLVPLDPQ